MLLRFAVTMPLLCLATMTAQTPPPLVQWIPAAASTAEAGKPWRQLLDTGTLSSGRYRLQKGAADGQSPHDRDEVYFIVNGKAKLEAGGETRAVAPGDTVFVAAGVAHHFLDIEQDLDVLVLFSAARPDRGGMREGPVPTAQTPYPETSARGCTRIFYWFGPDSAGQVAIDHGQPRWQDAFDKFLRQPSGVRWRLGENFWTTLDTNIALCIGGVEVPVGQDDCVLQNQKQGGLQLVLLDPQLVRQRRLDAYEAAKTEGGIVVPLTLQQAAVPATRLSFELTVDRAQKDHGALAIRFGPHELHAEVVLHPQHD